MWFHRGIQGDSLDSIAYPVKEFFVSSTQPLFCANALCLYPNKFLPVNLTFVFAVERNPEDAWAITRIPVPSDKFLVVHTNQQYGVPSMLNERYNRLNIQGVSKGLCLSCMWDARAGGRYHV